MRILLSILLMVMTATAAPAAFAEHPLVQRQSELKRRPFQLLPQLGHSGTITAMGASRDGRFFATTDSARITHVWETKTWRQVATLTGHSESGMRRIEFSANGKRLAVSGTHRGVEIWDLDGQERLHQISAGMSVSRTTERGQTYICSGYGLHAHDSGTGKKLWDAKAGAGCRAFQDDGKVMAVPGPDGIELWSTGRSPRKLTSLPGIPADKKTQVHFSQDGQRVAVFHIPTRVGAVFDTRSQEQLLALSSKPRQFYNAVLSPDGRLVAMRGIDSTAVQEVSTGKVLFTLRRTKLNGINSVAFDPQGRWLAVARMRDLSIYALPSGALIADRPARIAFINDLTSAKNGLLGIGSIWTGGQVWDLNQLRMLHGSERAHKHALNTEGDRVMRMDVPPPRRVNEIPPVTLQELDAQTGRKLATVPGRRFDLRRLARAGDQVLAFGGMSATLEAWTWTQSGLTDHRKTKLEGIPIGTSVGVAAGRPLAAFAAKRRARVWDVATMKEVFSVKGINVSTALGGDWFALSHSAQITLYSAKSFKKVAAVSSEDKSYFEALAFSPDGKLLAAGDLRGRVWLWETRGWTRLGSFSAHSGKIYAVRFTEDGRFLASAGSDGVTRVFNLRSGESVNLVATGEHWLAFNEEGYFDASRHGGQLVAMVKDRTPYRVDQFAIRNNRPDILLADLGVDGGLRTHYESQHQRRLRRVGVTEAQLSSEVHVPVARITGLKQERKMARLQFEISDTRRDLARYNIYVNDVPIYGATGKGTTGRKAALEETIELTHGANKIEVSATNVGGAESYRVARLVNYSGEPKRALYFIGFGVSAYANPALTLEFAAKDAKDLGNALKALRHKDGGFSAVHVHTFVDAQVTRERIQSAKKLLAKASVDDTFVLFIAGHGVHDDDAQGTYYYLTHDADPAKLSDRAVTFDEVESLLQGVPPRRKLFLMDTCESGELLPSEATRYASAAQSRALSSRGIRRKKAPRAASKAQMPRTFLHDRNRWIYNDVLRRSGAVVLSSSRGGELSYESAKLSQGLFTHALLDALSSRRADKNRDGRVTTEELLGAVRRSVQRLSGGLQTPTIDRDNLEQVVEFPVPKITSSPRKRGRGKRR